MLPEAGWLYFGQRDVQQESYRLRLPASLHAEWPIFDSVGHWSVDSDVGAIRVFTDATELSGVWRHASLIDTDGGAPYFDVPQLFTDTASEDFVPQQARLERGQTVHFVSARSRLYAEPLEIYLLTDAQLSLDGLVPGTDAWANDEGTVQRLLHHDLGHLIEFETVGELVPLETAEDGTLLDRSYTASRSDTDSGDSSVDAVSPAGDSVFSEDERLHVERVTVDIDSIPPDIAAIIDPNYLLVRFGANELLEQNHRARETDEMGLRNREIKATAEYEDAAEELHIQVPMVIHDRLPTEFKLFVDVAEAESLATVRDAFAEAEACASASISDSLKDRVYFVLEGFLTTETPEGFVNNIVYPK